MQDEITINLRALDKKIRDKIEELLDKQLEGVPDEVNEEALDVLRKFEE